MVTQKDFSRLIFQVIELNMWENQLVAKVHTVVKCVNQTEKCFSKSIPYLFSNTTDYSSNVLRFLVNVV